jgi:hypothetical protein
LCKENGDYLLETRAKKSIAPIGAIDRERRKKVLKNGRFG